MTGRLTLAWIGVGAFGLAILLAAAVAAELAYGYPAPLFALGAAAGGYALGLAVAFVRFVTFTRDIGDVMGEVRAVIREIREGRDGDG